MNINNNNYSVAEILSMIERKELIVNREYQRASGIWPPGPSSYFIETILEGFTFPKIYLYEYLERSTRGTKKEIVDGQQRINTIQRYCHNEFALRGDSSHAGKKFSQLDDETQEKFLSYSVPVDVIRNASRSEILQMFRRMNAYTMPLNDAEKRHSSFQGAFKWFVNGLTDDLNEFFIEFGVFSERQIVRMADSALIADCFLAIERGVISTSPSDLTTLYKKYDEVFRNERIYRDKIIQAVDYISDHFSDIRKSFIVKPYAFHSLITAMVHNRFGIDEIDKEWRVSRSGVFAKNPVLAARELLAMAQAHEAKETDGPYGMYVWGCLSTTDRKARRTARVASILRALGAIVPSDVDANLS